MMGACLTACQTFRSIAKDTAMAVYQKENGKVKDAIIQELDKKSAEWKSKGVQNDWSLYTLLAIGAAGAGKGLKHIWDRNPKKGES